MTRITSTDQVMLLIQAQLQKKKKTEKKKTTGPSVSKKEAKPRPLSRFRSMLDQDALPENEVHRALITGVLTEKFGASLANDPSFQGVIDNVLKVISDDSDGKALLEKAMSELQEDEGN
ncbi:hypothetical protein [Fretibacter rubidus]|uniref:hypothetical protein n=1 Tax=Fretibacter rubidus TaxID=570162 RepID=UPI003529DB96